MKRVDQMPSLMTLSLKRIKTFRLHPRIRRSIHVVTEAYLHQFHKKHHWQLVVV